MGEVPIKNAPKELVAKEPIATMAGSGKNSCIRHAMLKKVFRLLEILL